MPDADVAVRVVHGAVFLPTAASADTPGLAAHAATLRSIAAQLEAAASAPGA